MKESTKQHAKRIQVDFDALPEPKCTPENIRFMLKVINQKFDNDVICKRAALGNLFRESLPSGSILFHAEIPDGLLREMPYPVIWKAACTQIPPKPTLREKTKPIDQGTYDLLMEKIREKASPADKIYFLAIIPKVRGGMAYEEAIRTSNIVMTNGRIATIDGQRTYITQRLKKFTLREMGEKITFRRLGAG